MVELVVMLLDVCIRNITCSNDDERKDRHKSSDKNKKTNDKDKGKRGFCSLEMHLSEDESGDDSNEEFLFLAIKEKDKGRSKRPKKYEERWKPCKRKNCFAC